MVDYTQALIWFASWPILIWLSYKFVMLNLKHHQKIEKLNEYKKES